MKLTAKSPYIFSRILQIFGEDFVVALYPIVAALVQIFDHEVVWFYFFYPFFFEIFKQWF
jgi:hypothetical protein